MKMYVTFGQLHCHRVNGKTFDADCVAVLEHQPSEDGRLIVNKYFGMKYCSAYEEGIWDDADMKFYLRGYINLRWADFYLCPNCWQEATATEKLCANCNFVLIHIRGVNYD